jgi:hypothetical protein
MRIASAVVLCLLAALLVGCAPSADVSGWEVAQKRSADARMESFPEIPVMLPPSPQAPRTMVSTSDMYGVYLKRLDEGSLFRRGYSAPTP